MENDNYENTDIMTKSKSSKSPAQRRSDEAPGQKKPGGKSASWLWWPIGPVAFLVLAIMLLLTYCQGAASQSDIDSLKTDVAALQTDKANASDLKTLDEKVDLTSQKLEEDIDGKFDDEIGQKLDKDVTELKEKLNKTRSAVWLLKKSNLEDKVARKRIKRVERKLDTHIATTDKPPGTYTIVQRPVLVDGE